jgi:uncharacterized protein (TIGR02266 family)
VDVELDVDYTAEDTYLMTDSAAITNVSTLGIFIRTDEPEPVGTTLKMRFTPHGADEPLQVEGRVVWVNEPDEADPSADPDNGMGVRFVDLEPELRERLVAMVRRIALLVEDE